MYSVRELVFILVVYGMIFSYAINEMHNVQQRTIQQLERVLK